MFRPLRHRDFRLLWAGMTVSLAGDGIFLVAIAWQVYLLSNGPTALAVVGVAMSVPHVAFLLIGGAISDRFERRKVMVAADLVRALAVGLLGVLSMVGALRLWHIMALVAVYGAGTAFFGPAFEAIVPDLVPEEELQRANSLDQFVRPAAWQLAGPALGGWIVAAWGPGGAFLADAVTFVASVAALLRMRPPPPAHETDGGTLLGEVREGLRFVRSRVWLWGTLVAATFAYLVFMGPSEVLLPFVVKNELRGSAADLGLVLAMGGVGAILAALVLGHARGPRRFMTFIYVVWTGSTLAIAGYGLARKTWQLMAACFVFHLLETSGLIVWTTTKQRLVPSRLLGRVSSLDWFISIGLLPLSFALTGPVAGVIGARATLVGAALLGGAATLAFLFLPGLRSVEAAERIGPDELVPGPVPAMR